jgi:hypothetical protein
MTEEDEAFEDLAKRQKDWGMQGSRKHQILRYAENVESKGTSMTQDEIIEMARQVEFEVGFKWCVNFIELEAFAKLVAEKAFQNGYEKGIAAFNDAVLLEREACARVCESYISESPHSWGGTTMAAAIRARGQA